MPGRIGVIRARAQPIGLIILKLIFCEYYHVKNHGKALARACVGANPNPTFHSFFYVLSIDLY
jgi:hypothetical protein